jgi:hypothetical protein
MRREGNEGMTRNGRQEMKCEREKRREGKALDP